MEEELDRFENQGVLSKVRHNEWAAPVVAVPKKDGHIRLCGDYKVPVNPVLEVDQYPLPRPNELYATLSGGNLFTTLDLSHAYTHRGLYQYTHLPFGITSSPVIFQDDGLHPARSGRGDVLLG